MGSRGEANNALAHSSGRRRGKRVSVGEFGVESE
ncbi:hypothetical protein CGLO_14358 [Colletotrichum gloeosporioides Cg-14]|uniref:Uncharacterized protein n=1 Tax=Colletotrichum gloeosporioides (strain Cg-14) TaxID=1237896 RepID=T0LE11_COLGC|nr:hypothetical protein CGLO_14358 [Colletotrichum gloeosporioides Cg-14]